MCCSTHLYIILKEIVTLLEEANIEYFAVYGTFLGIIRHGGLIPWDTDIDIAVFYDDKEKIIQLLNRGLRHLFFISQDNKHLVRINYSHSNKVHADVYFWGKNKNEAIDYLYNQNIPFNKLYPLVKRKFYDLDIFTPQTDSHLIGFYGNHYMNSAIKKYHSIENILDLNDNSPAIISVDTFKD